jgi:hypothetical protein
LGGGGGYGAESGAVIIGGGGDGHCTESVTLLTAYPVEEAVAAICAFVEDCHMEFMKAPVIGFGMLAGL